MTPFLRYKSCTPVYKAISWVIRYLPLPGWITIKTRYGVMLVPKSFRALTMTFDLVEPEIKKWLEELLKTADIFVDVGAAYGWYTLKATHIMKQGLVLAFEPNPQAYAVLQANLAINRISTDRVKTYMVALSDSEGITTINNKAVPTAKLDSILQREGIELSSKSIIKIDVEGMALHVLRGAKETLLKHKPKLVVELHPEEESVARYLKQFNYKVFTPSRYFLVAER